MFLKKKYSEKIFCIGYNKTGTTTLEKVLHDFGFIMGNQDKAEMLIKNYLNKEYRPIINFCKKAEAFQDVPFSLPFIWLILKENFPSAKFILTIRNEEMWYNSITRFHSKLLTEGNRIPSKEDLKFAPYRYKGYLLDYNKAAFNVPNDDVYNKIALINGYRRHNDNVKFYFKNDPNFIAIDVSDKDDYFKLCEFLNKKPMRTDFPHENKTEK